MKVKTQILGLVMAVGFIFPSPKQPDASESKTNRFTINQQKLRTGDIVLRRGKGFISEMFRKTSLNDARYSHAGILVVENDVFYVYHMIGTNTNARGGLKKDRLSNFCNSSENSAYAIYRFPFWNSCNDEIENYISKIKSENPIFDESFDLKTDNAIYCSELIYKAAIAISGQKLPVSALKGKQFVALDNLYCHPEVSKIIEVNY